MNLYAENILDHYRHPRGQGKLQRPSVRHREENASCGDALILDLKISRGKIIRLAWHGKGCAISQAAMSMLSEELPGFPLQKAKSLKPDVMLDLLKVPIGPRRLKCALLPLHALKNAIRKYKGQAAQSWAVTIDEH
ncbi:MAG: iron-sulfur cluster assembly scaffold protein [Candidatus Peribacteraceae bacterium]